MSKSHYDATATLTLKKITPVIKALFGELDDPGKVAESAELREVYLNYIAEDTIICWDVQGLADLCKSLGLPPKTNVCDYYGTLKEALALLGTHFLGEASNEEPWSVLVRSVLSDYSGDTADLKLVFELAKFLDDGHGLQSFLMEGCWHSRKPRMGEFGGDFVFVGRNFSQVQSTSDGGAAASNLDKALAKPAGAQQEAASLVIAQVRELLQGITDEAKRTEVLKLLTTALSTW